MKVLYIGKFARYYSTENYVRHALMELGHHVVPLDMSESHRSVELAEKMQPDFVLLSKPCIHDHRRAVKRMREICPVVTWAWDMFYGIRSVPNYFCLSDVVFTTDGGHDDEWQRRDINHRLLRQGIHAPDRVMFDTDYKYDVAFVGMRDSYKEREELVSWLEQMYGTSFLHIYKKRGIALNKLLARVKVVVGDSYPGDHYWSNRIYEMLGRGAFFLHPRTKGLDQEFTDAVHYVGYDRHDREELSYLINHFTKENELRERIRCQGFAHMETLTYEHRAAELVKQINAFRAAA